MNFSVGLTSFDALMHYVVYDPIDRSKCDTSQLLERPCYETWLKTRRVVPGNPEESYRRHLTSFLTGSKKRKPFPPEVEKDLLPRIRERRVWPCFDGYFDQSGKPITIGRTGFRARGYWEQREVVEQKCQEVCVADASSLMLEIPSPADTVDRYDCAADSEELEPLWLLEDLGDQCTVGFPSPGGSSVELVEGMGKRSVDEALCSWFIETMTSEMLGDGTGAEKRRRFEDGISFQLVEELFEKGKADPAVWKRMQMYKVQWERDEESLEELSRAFCIDQSEFLALSSFGETATFGLNLDSFPCSFRGTMAKAVCHLITPYTFRIVSSRYRNMFRPQQLKQPVYENLMLERTRNEDPRFQPSFRFVHTQQPWDFSRPIGRSCIDAKTGIYLKCDQAARTIMGGDFIGKNVAEIQKSMTFFLVSFLDLLPKIVGEGKCFFQASSRRLDGTPIILRMDWKLQDEHIYSTFQDVSNLYPHILALPDLQ